MSKWTKCEDCPGKYFEVCSIRGKQVIDPDKNTGYTVIGCTDGQRYGLVIE